MIANPNLVTVSRTVVYNGVVITETAWAEMPDALVLDDITEASRRSLLASLLINSLRPLPPDPKSSPCKPTNLSN